MRFQLLAACLTNFDVQEQPDVVQLGRGEVLQEILQPRHRLMWGLQGPQRLQVFPVTLDDLFFLAETTFERGILLPRALVLFFATNFRGPLRAIEPPHRLSKGECPSRLHALPPRPRRQRHIMCSPDAPPCSLDVRWPEAVDGPSCPFLRR